MRGKMMFAVIRVFKDYSLDILTVYESEEEAIKRWNKEMAANYSDRRTVMQSVYVQFEGDRDVL